MLALRWNQIDMESLSKAQKKGVAALLYELADADDHRTPEELYYIDKVTKSLDIPPHELDDIRLNPGSFPLDPPPDEERRMSIIYFLIFLCHADQEIQPAEKEVCKWMGLKLGFSPLMIDDMIALLNAHGGRTFPPDDLLDIIRKYLN